MSDIEALIERLDSHMGKADMGEVLADCRLAAQTILALRAAINDVLTHRHGDLPTLGYIRDNDESRAAIARLAALATEAE